MKKLIMLVVILLFVGCSSFTWLDKGKVYRYLIITKISVSPDPYKYRVVMKFPGFSRGKIVLFTDKEYKIGQKIKLEVVKGE